MTWWRTERTGQAAAPPLALLLHRSSAARSPAPGNGELGASGVAILFLIRHGAHAHLDHTLSGRQADLPLTDIGRAQAASLGKWLAGQGLTALHASPVQRARETADSIGAACGLPVTVAPALEEIDFGHWTGRSFAELSSDPAWCEWNNARATARAPGGETMDEALDRAAAHLATLTARTTVVTHCDIVRGLVCRVLGLSLNQLHRFAVDAASVTRLDPTADTPLLSLNETAPWTT